MKPSQLEKLPQELIERFKLDQLPFAQKTQRLDELVGLQGLRALVTGGGGAGLGQACVHRLAAMGASVAVFDLNGDAAQRVASEAGTHWKAKTIGVAGSAANWDDAHRAVQATVEAFGGIDLLVNCAGGFAPSQYGPFQMRTKEDIDGLVATNLFSALYPTRAALDFMIPNRSGRIINISAEGVRVPATNIGVYNACKAAVEAFTLNLCHDVAQHGITAVAVSPGIMISDQILGNPDAVKAFGGAVQHGFERTTLGRYSIPEEVANVVAFLASPAASYVQGTVISVGGGMSA